MSGSNIAPRRHLETCSSEHASAGDQLVDDHHHCDHQEEVDETAADVEGHKPKKPKNQKNNRKRIKHGSNVLVVRVVWALPLKVPGPSFVPFDDDCAPA